MEVKELQDRLLESRKQTEAASVDFSRTNQSVSNSS